MKKRICILGSTGSIGTQALDVIAQHSDLYEAYVLTAYNNADLLIQQARKYMPEAVVIAKESNYETVKEGLSDLPIKVYTGADALCQVVQDDQVDIVLASMVGFAGLEPTIAAIKAQKMIALANKETLVVGGDIIMAAARRKGVEILPIDSEHSAIMQCLEGEKRKSIRNLIVTCSGGALRNHTLEELKEVTPEIALKHPQWSMGSKITIDSATLVNKGFEVIEARWLFDIEPERIKVVIHPQSIVHSMVEFTDGSVKAQLGNADMHTPISYALLYPERAAEAVEEFSILDYPTLTFAEVDRVKYPALDIAYECLKRGGTAACTMNGANEVAVAAFLGHKCGYLDIVGAIRYALDNATFTQNPTLDDYDRANDEARELARRYLKL